MNKTVEQNFRFRDLLLGIIVFGILGLVAELLLQEHTESWQQWIPLVLLGLGLATSGLVYLRPSSGALNAFRALMVMFVLAGALGVYLHFAGNVEFEIERTPELSGLPLIWKSLKGATPALAPGALAQLGLLGLLYGYRHPAGRNGLNGSMSQREIP
jgi:hypothetical protein